MCFTEAIWHHLRSTRSHVPVRTTVLVDQGSVYQSVCSAGLTLGLIVDPAIDLVCSCLGVAEVHSPVLTLEVGLVGGHEARLQREPALAEEGVGHEHLPLLGPRCQGLVEFLQHLVRSWRVEDVIHS